MSNSPIPSLQSLPVEILHRIFNSLNAQTILLSLRNTCRQLKAVVNSYKRYVLNFKSISKSDFYLLCHLIDPQNVISLTLSHDDQTLDQIELFLSLCGSRRFHRLRSLTLLTIDERHLQFILRRVNVGSLISFSLKIGKSDDRCRFRTAKLLSSTISQPNLRKFELDFRPRRIEQISWPSQCGIEYLRIGTFRYEAFDHICKILLCSPHLKTLVISCSTEIYYFEDASKHPLQAPFKQLTSLTFENMSTKIDNLELFLSLTPSLTHLKMIGNGHFLDGNRWEQFIQANLPSLNTFEFCFTEWRDIQQTPADIESIIALYRTPFWLEHKMWFVTCEYNIDRPRSIELYSIPVCESFLQYGSELKKVSLSTFPNAIDNDVSIMNNVDKIMLDFAKLIPFDMEPKVETRNKPLFGKINRLELAFHANRPIGWIPFLSTLMNLTTVTEIQLTGALIEQADLDMLADIANLLQRTSNLSSLDIRANRLSRESRLTAENICFITPSHVKHLAVPIKNVDELEITLERLEHLSSAKFYFNYSPYSNRITAWLAQKKKGSTCRTTDFSVCIWLGTSNIQSREVNVSNKRIKLTSDHYDS